MRNAIRGLDKNGRGILEELGIDRNNKVIILCHCRGRLLEVFRWTAILTLCPCYQVTLFVIVRRKLPRIHMMLAR